MRILLVEDDQLIGDGIQSGLSKLGFHTDWFTDGGTALEAPYSAPYDAVILDLGLPDMDGMDLLKSWRERRQDIPVLILTARDAIEQRVEGLKAGADDYLGKPFALAELAARLQALIRRRAGQVFPVLTFENISFDTGSRKVSNAGIPVDLTATELSLLELFLRNRERILPKELIREKLSQWDEELSDNTLEVHVHNLRKKLGTSVIRTVRGVGYSLGRD